MRRPLRAFVRRLLDRSSRRVVQRVLVENVEARQLLAAINGTVFGDANGNGRRDAGEAGVSGVAVYADYNYDGKLNAGEPGASTDASGAYTITVDVRPFALRTAPALGQTQTAPGGNAPYYYEAQNGKLVGYGSDFGVSVAPPANTDSIFGYVRIDANDNGRVDLGEPGVGGQTVFADYNYNGTLDAGEPSTTSAAQDGSYVLNGVQRTNYALRLIPSAAYGQALPAGNAPNYIEYRDGQYTALQTDFAVRSIGATYSMSGVIYNDANANGKRDAGESGAPTGTFAYIDLNDNRTPEPNEPQGYVDPTGAYTISGIRIQDNYRLRIYYDRTAYRQTQTPYPGVNEDVAHTFLNGGPNAGYDFGLTTQGGTIALSSFRDLNGNGTLDENEPRVGHAWYDLNRNGRFDLGEPEPFMQFTGGHPGGAAYFAQFGALHLPFGTYQLALDTSTGDGGDATADFVTNVTISAAQPFVSWTFVVPVQSTTAVYTHVYLDSNKNGTIDASEVNDLNGVIGQTVFADYNYNGVLDAGEASGVTDLFGRATLNVLNKPFALRLIPASGYAKVSPAANGVFYYELKGGAPVGYGNSFGVATTTVTPPPPTGQSSIALNYFADYDGDGKQTAGVDGSYSVASFDTPRAFIDANRNGVFDAGDVQAYFNQFTGGGGYYSFDSLAAGTYRLVLSAGLQSGESVYGGATRDITIGDNASTTVDVPVEGFKYAQLNTNIFFDTNRDGYQEPGELNANEDDNQTGVLVYVDLNFNGVRDANEPRINLIDHYSNASGITLLPGGYSIRAEQNGKPATFAYGATSRWVTLSKPGLYSTQLGIVSSN